VLQNREAFRFFDGIAGESGAVYHTADALGARERIWILAKLPSDLVVAGRDRVGEFHPLSNSHDGERAVQVRFTPVRVVCRNTPTQALIRVQQAMGVITRRYDGLARLRRVCTGAARSALACGLPGGGLPRPRRCER